MTLKNYENILQFFTYFILNINHKLKKNKFLNNNFLFFFIKKNEKNL